MFWQVTLSLLEGFGMTLTIFALTLLFAIPLGLVIAFGSMSKLGFVIRRFGKTSDGMMKPIPIYPIALVCKFLVWVIRGTPLMLQLIVIYYGPGLLGGQLLPRFTAVMVAFVVNYACYFSEIFRGGIESIPKGQYEAGQVLGMTKTQTFFNVVLLQVVKRVVPPMGNEIITLVKDTSLARVIAVYEIIWSAQAYIKLHGLLWPLLYTAVFYLLFSGLLTLLFGYIEKKLDYFKA
ncbi:MAG: amino acid ABC transporter permease [Clostridia bacterium]|nr:amino acid ABC transporter permease [Clostridia bacterium]